MKLVIDLQAAQTSTALSPFGKLLPSLVRRLAAERPQWQIHLVVNDLVLSALVRLRRQLAGCPANVRLHVWSAPAPVNWSQPQNRLRCALAIRIRRALIAGLHPDLVVVAGLYEGFADQAVTDFSPVVVDGSEVPVLVLVPPAVPSTAAGADNSSRQLFTGSVRQQLRHATLFLLDVPIDTRLFAREPDDPEDRCRLAPCSSASALRDGPHQFARWLASCCVEALEGHGRNPRRAPATMPRPRLACVSPLPPEKTGIATYTAELLPHLARWYDIDVVTDQTYIANLWIRQQCGHLSMAEFSRVAGAYDRVLYHIGNSPFHWPMFSLLPDVPGVVVLHDFYLGNTLERFAAEHPDRLNFRRLLYQCHGFGALTSLHREGGVEQAVWDYPCNLPVLTGALGLISHSEHARQLLRTFYPGWDLHHWQYIPLLRATIGTMDKAQTRRELGLPGDEFIVAAFGAVTANKLATELLRAWQQSTLGQDAACHLIFVGEMDAGSYGASIRDMITEAVNAGAKITVTGWVNDPWYHAWMDAVDLAVQLRCRSRGESSGAVLDCMNHGLPVITNACGAMAELPTDAVCLLPEEVAVDTLAEELDHLYRDPELRRRLGDVARSHIRTEHGPQQCAERYYQAIESCYRPEAQPLRQLLPELAGKRCSLSEGDRRQLDLDLAKTFAASPAMPALYIDVTITSRNQLRTGIERVTTALARALMSSPPPGYRIEPVRLCRDDGRWQLHYARRYALKLLGFEDCDWLQDDPVTPASGDLYLCPEISGDLLAEAIGDGVYSRLQAAGVGVTFLIHDLLPLTLPQCFPPGADVAFAGWLKNVCSVADTLIAVTRTVATDVSHWLDTASTHLPERPMTIGWSHHGADLDNHEPPATHPMDTRLAMALPLLAAGPTFLMVGTVEPRKGYQLALDAFDLLWSRGSDGRLVIVGGEGWRQVPEADRRDLPRLVHDLKGHPHYGKRLFWFESLDDSDLQLLYRAANCLLALSLGEGFGLPLIEAAHHRLPLLLRDLPVFREVAGDHADYIDGETPIAVATAITSWLTRHRDRDALAEKAVPHLSWQQSADQLFYLMTKRQDDATRPESVFFGIHQRLERRRRPHIFVDVSVISRKDYRTGIQRTTRALLLQLAQLPDQPCAVVPVRFEPEEPAGYRVVPGFLGLDTRCCEAVGASLVTPEDGDIFLGLDLAGHYVIQADEAGVFQRYRQAGARVLFVVYDLLPVTWPQFFRPGVALHHEHWLRVVSSCDGALCISATVARELRNWLDRARQWPLHRFALSWFHLGGDPENSAPTSDMPADAGQLLATLADGITFLMVGTVEPRKGYSQALKAFDQLWNDGLTVNLVIVGRVGWLMEGFEEEVRSHPQRGRHLFRLDQVSDSYLEGLYRAADCLVAASKDEGFGLPLIEAAQHGMPLLVRDIPVFREVAGGFATYFPDSDAPADLAFAVKNWLDAWRQQQHRTSQGLPWLTWARSAADLQQRLQA